VTISDRNEGPGLVAPLCIVAIALILRFVPGWVAPMTMAHFVGLAVGPLFGVLGLLVWWLFARRVRLRERLVGISIVVAILAAGWSAVHTTMQQAMITHATPGLLLLFAGVLVVTRTVAWPSRRWIVVAAVAVALLPWSFLRMAGQVGDLAPEFVARRRPTAEEQFLAARRQPADATTGDAALDDVSTDWPGYRGPFRDGRVHGVSFDTDWNTSPPREVWRRRVGPGWSSFAVAGDRAFTQEQRGDREVIACYSLTDGHEIWAEATTERFEEPSAGPGPRATPTFDDGWLYALGAHGTLQALDASTGERRWQRNLQEDVAAPLPTWGFSSSPLVAEGAVVVFAGAPDGKAVVAYDRETGDLRWTAGEGTLSYSSAHRARIRDVDQVLIATDIGVQSFEPEDGRIAWEHRWPTTQMPRIVQPVVLDGGGSVILATGYGYGSRRLDLERQATGEWIVREEWSSRFLKPYFNGLVCHRGSCYGFDGNIFTCIGADDGERRWKGGRYGHGQVVLLADMNLLLVLTERGEVVLVEATPEAHREVGRFQALSGKSWNHPVVTQGKLLVRNGEEAACFELKALTPG